MNRIKSALLVILLGLIASQPAWADRGHHRGGHGRANFGLSIGIPLFSPYYPQTYYPQPYYPQPYYYPPAVQYSPPVYIEQQPSQQYWYFCSNPQGYHPYVQQCPPGWQQVTPQPPGN